jgi:hypothetical protein
MATTTNYSWTTPDDTALVKDGAAAIRSLGTAIDTTVFTNASAAIAKSIVDAKGDLIAGTADNTVARLASGSNGNVLTVDTSTATGLAWVAPAGGGKVLQVVQATYGTATTIASTTLTDTGLSATITPSSATSKILVMYSGNVRLQASQSDSCGLKSAIIRGATKILGWDNNYTSISVVSIVGVGLNVLGEIVATNYLDSPSTTSATTYKIQMAAHDTTNSGQVIAQFGGNSATLILMEIGA